MKSDKMNYINFLLKSTNQHSVHSPFVFDLVTKCLYCKKKISTGQLQKAVSEGNYKRIIKLVEYFSVKSVCTFPQDEEFEKNIMGRCVKVGEKTCDLLVVTDLYGRENEREILGRMHNDSILVITSPYKGNEKLYENVLKNEKTTAIVNLFYMAIVFIRKEQRKQVFFIRG